MSNSLEFEAKVLLDKHSYEMLKESFSQYDCYTQTNHYVDTGDLLLRKNRVSLRIREKDVIELTMKTLLPDGGRLETTDIISKCDCEGIKNKTSFPDGEVARKLAMMGYKVEDLIVIASLKTIRIDVPYLGGTLSLDENHYSDIIDYEIEYESDSVAKAGMILKGLLDSKGIPYKENKITKTARALNASQNK